MRDCVRTWSCCAGRPDPKLEIPDASDHLRTAHVCCRFGGVELARQSCWESILMPRALSHSRDPG